MEYMDMVSKIVAAEHAATELVQEGKTREDNLKADLDHQVTDMRDRYLDRARHRLTLVAETEEQAAQESIERLDKRFETAMAEVESAYEKNKEQWVDTLFTMIVGAQP